MGAVVLHRLCAVGKGPADLGQLEAGAKSGRSGDGMYPSAGPGLKRGQSGCCFPSISSFGPSIPPDELLSPKMK